jgi:hypothetical protein
MTVLREELNQVYEAATPRAAVAATTDDRGRGGGGVGRKEEADRANARVDMRGAKRVVENIVEANETQEICVADDGARGLMDLQVRSTSRPWFSLHPRVPFFPPPPFHYQHNLPASLLLLILSGLLA